MTTELYWLTATITMTGIFWVPYILNRLAESGIRPALFNPKPDELPRAPWADRMMHAHSNAVENLVIFAPLVLMLHFVGISTDLTVLATVVYFWTRLAHFVIYTFGIPLLRTIAFFVGFLAQMILAKELFGL